MGEKMGFPSGGLYAELRALAYALMRRENRRHTLSPTDLFHEAYVRLRPRIEENFEELRNTKALFIVTMRRILIDHARRRISREKALRGAGLDPQRFSDFLDANGGELRKAQRLLLLEEALETFYPSFPEHAKVVENRFFQRMTIPQCATALGISEATVQRRWEASEMWLIDKIRELEQR